MKKYIIEFPDEYFKPELTLYYKTTGSNRGIRAYTVQLENCPPGESTGTRIKVTNQTSTENQDGQTG